MNRQALSRKFLPIPNAYVQRLVSKLPEGLDGELVVTGDFGAQTSAFMSHQGEPAFAYHVFDWVRDGMLAEGYLERIQRLKRWCDSGKAPLFVHYVPWEIVYALNELEEYEEEQVERGFEGVCLRVAAGPYKCGRSTFKEHYLLKMKRFEDGEAEVIGFDEAEENLNAKGRDNLGHAKRSSHKANKRKKGTLGALVCRDLATGVEFRIGTGRGLTDQVKAEIWRRRKSYVGSIAHYRYQDHGSKDAPRIPSFMGFRDGRDM